MKTKFLIFSITTPADTFLALTVPFGGFQPSKVAKIMLQKKSKNTKKVGECLPSATCMLMPAKC